MLRRMTIATAVSEEHAIIRAERMSLMTGDTILRNVLSNKSRAVHVPEDGVLLKRKFNDETASQTISSEVNE
jgi:hypothetical protein